MTPPFALPKRLYRQITLCGFGVRVLKLLLSVTTVAILVLVLTWSYWAPNKQHLGYNSTAGAADLAPVKSKMVNLRYIGLDNKNQPFMLTSLEVFEDSVNGDRFFLKGPQGNFRDSSSHSWMAVVADSGLFLRKEEILHLIDDITFYHSSGLEIHTDFAEVNTKTADVISQQMVSGQSRDRRFEGEGFRIEQKGNLISLTGKSRLIISPSDFP